MKKRVIIFILFVFFLLPFYIEADTYNEARDKANSFLDKNEYKNSYIKYLFTTDSNKFTEMISKEEFEITRYDKNMNYRNINYSYLWDSRPFWSNVENVPIRDGYIPVSGSESTDNIGTKLTQIIKNDASVYGSGTYSDPWLFAPQYRVRIKVNDMTKGNITNSSYTSVDEEVNFVYTAGSGIQYIYVKSIGANQYLGSTCGYVINGINANDKYASGTGGYLLVSNITRDTECIINFGEKPRVVKLDSSYNELVDVSPNELYMSPETGWYGDKFGNEQIIQINTNPERLGYIYEGYRIADSKENACNSSINIIEPPYKDLTTNGYNLINNPKNKQLNNDRNVLKNIENNDTLYACYTPIHYTIAYNCNGATSGSTSSSNHVYNEEKSLTLNGCIRTGYDFNGWNTSSNGTGSFYGNNQKVTGIYSIHNGTLQLYAMWRAKDDIVYKVNHYIQNGNDDNYSLKETIEYKDGTSDTTKTINPTTYEGFTSPSSQTVVIKPDGSTVVNFYYIRNSYTVVYSCNNGTGTTASSMHKYNVEKSLTANGCTRSGYNFDGWATTATGNVTYTDAQTVKNLTTENNKMITLYAHWSKCSAGTYGSDGKTCSTCPTGYTSDAGVDSINDCYLITTAGKYVATANQNQTTCAANGYCAGGTKIYYGSTGGRTGCPANYGTSAAGSDAATDCYLTTTAGNYVASANAAQTTCAANGYCPGGTKVYYNSTGGRTGCPANYGTSAVGSDAASDCYLTTTAGKYVATANAAQATCAANGYCAGGTKVNYGSTGGRTGCPTNYGTSVAGSDAASDCYLTTTAGKYVATVNAAQATCAANGYCAGGTKIYYGGTGGRTGCPTNYGTSAAGSDAAADCYLTTTAGKYVATANAAEVTCTANYYCAGGIKIYYGGTGGRTACSTGYHSSSGASSCTANTYTVVYNKNSTSASGSMSDSTHTYGTAKNLTANAYSRSGYTFNGWNTKADGSGTSYSNKASVSNLTSIHNGTVNLYAKWKLAVSCDAAAITYYNQNWNINGGYPYECNVYNGVYNCSANTSTGKCDCDIKAFYSGSKYYCCNFDNKSISPSYTDDSGFRWCERSYNPVSKSGSCNASPNSYNWCDKYW